MLIEQFEEMSANKEGSRFLCDLPFEEFLSLVIDDNLYVKEEIVVVKAIDRYMNHRKELPQINEAQPSKPQDEPRP